MNKITHNFCKLLARKLCKEAKVRITYLYIEPKNEYDSHWTIHGDSEMEGFKYTSQACCKYSAIINTIQIYLNKKKENDNKKNKTQTI